MSIGSFIGDVLSGGAVSAGREKRKSLNNAMETTNSGYTKAGDALTQGFGGAQDYLRNGFSSAIGTETPLFDATSSAYQGLLGRTAAGDFDPNKYQFHKDPGYDFAMSEGLKPIQEMTASNGRSGAEEKALIDYATGTANKAYGEGFARNQGALAQNFGEAQSLAAPAIGLGENIAGLQANQGQGQSSLAAQLGGLQSGLATGNAEDIANLQLGKGQVNAGISQAGYAPITKGLGGILDTAGSFLGPTGSALKTKANTALQGKLGL